MGRKSYGLITETESGAYNRKKIFNIYMAKYYNLYMGAYRIKGDDITEDMEEFILRRFWSMGKLACFIVKNGEKFSKTTLNSVNTYDDGLVAFTDFAPTMYNIYDWPIVVNLIQTRGAKFIPATSQNVNESVVIGYCQKNKLPVKTIVEWYVSRITDIEMTIKQQLNSHKVPWLVATNPENEAKMKKLFENIESDETSLFLSADEVDSIKTLMGGNATYIIDKLYNQKQAYENELLTYLGIDNLGQLQKKEHFVVDEVNSNNELINDNSDCFVNCVKAFFKRIEEHLGKTISIEPIARPVMAESEKGEENNESDVEKQTEI